jgi:nucleotide-binding universal stress UspA family protein
MRILVPVDGTAPSQRAVRHAATLASGCFDSHVILLNVQNRATLGLSDIGAEEPPDEVRQAHRASEKLFQESVSSCHDAGVSCETMAEVGPVAETIARVANEIQADQIVMGTRGLNSFSGLLMGSVTTRTVHFADVPVTLIK